MVFQCGAVVGTLMIIDGVNNDEPTISPFLNYATTAFVWIALISTIHSGAIYVKASIDLIPKLTKSSEDSNR